MTEDVSWFPMGYTCMGKHGDKSKAIDSNHASLFVVEGIKCAEAEGYLYASVNKAISSQDNDLLPD